MKPTNINKPGREIKRREERCKYANKIYSEAVWSNPNKESKRGYRLLIIKLLLEIIDIVRDIRFELNEHRIKNDYKKDKPNGDKT